MRSLLISLLTITTAFAAGGDGSIADLAAPAVNFIIFLAILFFALKNSIKSYFATHADNVAATYERAQIKKKEADARISEAETKMKNSDQEIERIKNKTKEDISNFEKTYSEEIVNRIGKYKEDSKARVKAEESTLLNNLNARLVDSVISKAKETIKADPSLKQKATERMVKEVH